MAIDFFCPLCLQGCQAASGLEGRRARCPFCHEIVEIENIGESSTVQTDAWDEDSAMAAALSRAGGGNAAPATAPVQQTLDETSSILDETSSISGFQPVDINAMNDNQENPFATPVTMPAAPQRYVSRQAEQPNPFAGNPFTLTEAPAHSGGDDDDFVFDLSDDDDEPGDEDEDVVPFGGKREREESDMDMTPMVDVTFLLLIFFMVTAAFSMQRSLPTPVPEQQDEPSTQARTLDDFEQDNDYIVVRIDAFNTYTVITPDSEQEAPSKQDLLIQLRRARSGGTTGKVPTSMLVLADLEALHGRVVDALDAGTAVGMQRIQMLPVDEEAE